MAHLLLVDDDAVLLDLIARLLGRLGHTVVTASNAAEAIARAHAQAFDVILTDVMMPDMDGYALTHHLRASLPPPGPRILIFTSRLQGPDADLAHAAGADGYLMKTVNVDRLLTAIAQVMGTPPV